MSKLHRLRLKEHGIVPAISIALPVAKDANIPPPKLMNVLSSDGKYLIKPLRIVQKQEHPKEAVSGSSFGQVLRMKNAAPKGIDSDKWASCVHKVADKGEDADPYAVCGASLQNALVLPLKKKVSESNKPRFVLKKRFQESVAGTSRYLVVLISEGLGNMRDGFYYTGEALADSAPLFDGQKCYANHPSSTEEVVLPERDVRDIVGHFENVNPIHNGDHVELQGELVIMQGSSYDWVRAQLDHALDFSSKFQDKDFIGLSINAGGEADPVSIDNFLSMVMVPESCRAKVLEAQAQGLTQVRVVQKITEAISCDLVTQAGAGGRIIQAI